MFRRIEYFYATIKDESGEGFRFLSRLASRKGDLIALTAVPFGPDKAQMTLFPSEVASLLEAAKVEGISLDGPHSAIFVQGQDRVGAFAEVLSKLAAVEVNVFSVQGMTDGRGGFGYLLYLKPSDIDRALKALN